MQMFSAMLALAALAGALVLTASMTVARATAAGAEIVRIARENAMRFALLLTGSSMLGSLYFSEIADYAPCKLCWYQRICMYPLSAILLVGALRRDRKVWMYAGIPAVVGVVIASYHTQLQAFPKQRTFCDPENPCTNRFVWEFGFISLPLMDLIAFCFIITMLVASAVTSPSSGSTDDVEADEPQGVESP